MSGSEQLASLLQFELKKKPDPDQGSAQRTKSLAAPDQGSTQCRKRVAALYRYDPDDPAEYHTKTLLNDNFDRWKEQPASFWLQLPQNPCETSNDPQCFVILAALKVGQSSAHSFILRRFYCVVLHQLRAAQPQGNDSETIARSIYSFVHPGISQPDANGLHDLTKNVEGLVQAGSRYVNIAKRLGMGSLFLLGELRTMSVSSLQLIITLLTMA